MTEYYDDVARLYLRTTGDEHSFTIAHKTTESHAIRQTKLIDLLASDLRAMLCHELGNVGIGFVFTQIGF